MVIRAALAGVDPKDVDPDKVRAESKQGVLSIHLQKRTEAKPRSIQVKVQ